MQNAFVLYICASQAKNHAKPIRVELRREREGERGSERTREISLVEEISIMIVCKHFFVNHHYNNNDKNSNSKMKINIRFSLLSEVDNDDDNDNEVDV